MTRKGKYFLIYIKENGKVEQIRHDDDPSLEYLQNLVGGPLEVLPSIFTDYGQRGVVVVVDEEGKLKGKQFNKLATEVADIRPGDFIVGDAVLVIGDGENLCPIYEGRARRICLYALGGGV